MTSFYHAWRFRVFCNRQQNTPDSEFLLEKYQSNSLGKGYPRLLLSGKFTESCTTLLHRATLRRLHKYIQNTHSKPFLTKVNFGSKFVCKNWPLFHSKKCTNPLNYFSEFAVNHSIAATGSPFKHFRCHTIKNNLFFLTRRWFLRSSVN